MTNTIPQKSEKTLCKCETNSSKFNFRSIDFSSDNSLFLFSLSLDYRLLLTLLISKTSNIELTGNEISLTLTNIEMNQQHGTAQRQRPVLEIRCLKKRRAFIKSKQITQDSKFWHQHESRIIECINRKGR